MKTFQPKLFICFKNYGKGQLVNDIVAGVIVAIIALPLSIAIAIASGVSPEQGLYTAVIAGFFIAFFGGSRVNISSPTPGALPVPSDTVVYEVHGPLFFADTDIIREFTLADTTKTMIIRMGDVATVDASAMKVLEDLSAECKKNNTRLVLSHVNAHPLKVMQKAGFFDALGAENFPATIEEALEIAEQTK